MEKAMSQIFNQVTVIPAESMEVVLLLNTGDILSPVMFSVSTKNFKTAEGRIPTSAISGWAEVNTIKKALNLPELTKEEFMEGLSLQSLLFYSEDVEVFFDDNDMFLGHSLIASDFDGENFNYAQMFG